MPRWTLHSLTPRTGKPEYARIDSPRGRVHAGQDKCHRLRGGHQLLPRLAGFVSYRNCLRVQRLRIGIAYATWQPAVKMTCFTMAFAPSLGTSKPQRAYAYSESGLKLLTPTYAHSRECIRRRISHVWSNNRIVLHLLV